MLISIEAHFQTLRSSLQRNMVKHGRWCLLDYFENDDFFMCAFHSLKIVTTLKEFYDSRMPETGREILLKFSLNLSSSFYPKKKKIIS